MLFMLQHSFTYAVCIKLCSNSRLNIIVHLDIAYSVLQNDPVDHLIHMSDHFGVSEIKLISASVKTRFPWRTKNQSSGAFFAFSQLIPITSSSSHSPGTIPFCGYNP